MSYKLVEVAGVEPAWIVHLFASICIHLHLSLFISTLRIYRDAGKCRWMHLNAGKLANNWQIENVSAGLLKSLRLTIQLLDLDLPFLCELINDCLLMSVYPAATMFTIK